MLMNFKRTAAAALAALAVVFAVPSQVYAANTDISAVESVSSYSSVITVNSRNGQNEDDIQSALERLRGGGGTVRLSGFFRITKTLNMYSNQTLDASGCTISSSIDKVVYSYKMRNVTVRGGTWYLSDKSELAMFSRCRGGGFDSVTTYGGGSFGYGGIYIALCDNINITNCRVSDIKSEGIYFYRSTNFNVVSCTVKNCGGHGIRIFGSSGFGIYGNNITNPKGDGISCSQNINGKISGNTFTGVKKNPLLDIDPSRNISRAGCGILISDSADINVGTSVTYDNRRFEGNTVSDCENYGMHITTSTNTFVNKTNISDTASDGIHNSASSGTTIQNCKISGCRESGISMLPGPVESVDLTLRQCRDSIIRTNTIDKCRKFGIFFSLSDSCKASDNRISNCTDYGIYCNAANKIAITGADISTTKTYKGSGIGISPSSTNISLDINIKLNKTNISLGLGESYQLTGNVNSIIWSSSNSSIVTVSNGKITAKKTGTAVISAKLYGGKPAQCTVTVRNAPDSVKLSVKSLNMKIGQTASISSIVPENSSSAKRTYFSSDSSIVKMTKTNWTGTFKALKKGKTFVTVRLYNGVQASCPVTVS